MERTVFIMEKNLTRISTRSMSRQAWLAERRKTIGGSDAAGIVGLSRYATPYIRDYGRDGYEEGACHCGGQP